MIVFALLAAVAPTLAAPAPHAPAAGPDPWGTRMVLSLGLGPWTTMSGSSDGSYTQTSGGLVGSQFYTSRFSGGEFHLPASFEFNADGMGAAFGVGYATGAGVWSSTQWSGTNVVTSGRMWLSGEFDFTPLRRPGMFFGVGPAVHLGSRSESESINCGSGLGLGGNQLTATTSFARIGAAARLRMAITRTWSLRASTQLLLLGFGGHRFASTCPGFGFLAYDAGIFAPVFAAEIGAAFRVNRLFSVAADLGFRYERFSASYTQSYFGGSSTQEFSQSYLAVYVVPRLTAQLNF